MRIGFDAKRIFQNTTGLGNYSRTLVKNLAEQFPENDYYLFASNKNDGLKLPPDTKIISSNAVIKSYWRSFGIKNDLLKNNIDIYHGLSNEIPFQIKKTGIRSVVTIHDLIFKHFPGHYPLFDRTIYNIKSKYACSNADVIIAISESTKKDIIEFYKIDESKIKVVYQSCDDVFLSYEALSKSDRLIKYRLPISYILYVGSITERKNLLKVCEAYLQIEEKKRIPCVVIGKGRGYAEKVKIFIAENKLENYFIFLENIANSELPEFYKNATAFIYPSLYEGFGIPILEAMASGCPVITSHMSSMPEVAGEAALYFYPYHAHLIAEKIIQVTEDSDLRNEMIKKGFLQSELFVAKKNTEQVMQIYKSLVVK